MADINLSDITGVPVLMPVVRTYDWSSLVTFQGMGTPTTVQVKCHRVGKQGFVSGKVTIGTPSSAQARVNLPSGVSIEGPTGINACGSFEVNQSTANIYKSGVVLVDPSTPSYLMLGYREFTTAGSPFTARNGDQVFSGPVFFTFSCEISVTGWDEYEAIGTGVAKRDRAGLISAEDSGNVNLSFSGAQSGSVAAKYAMSGKMVSIWVNGNAAAATAANGSIAISLANIPVECRPKNGVSGFIRCLVGGASTICLYDLDSAANTIYIYANSVGAAWSANGTANSRFVSFFVSYPLTDNP